MILEKKNEKESSVTWAHDKG